MHGDVLRLCLNDACTAQHSCSIMLEAVAAAEQTPVLQAAVCLTIVVKERI
jgi:hypothetical protein